MDLKNIVLILFFSTCFNSWNAQVTSEETAYSQVVESLLEDNQYKKALKTLDKVLESDPSDLYALSKRADIHVTMENEKDAMKDIRSILRLDDQNAEGQMIYAKLKYYIGERDSALFYIDQGLSFDPNLSTTEELYGLRGNILMSLDRYEEAEESLYMAAKSPEVSLETMKNLATVLVENDKLDEAGIVLKETLEIFGHHLESYINTGYVSNKIGLYDEALFYLEEALNLEPDNPYALSNAALAYLHTGQLDRAFKAVEKSIKNDNTNSFAYRVKGECLMAMEENERACKEFKKAIQMGYTVLHEQTEITKLVIASCGTD